MSIRISSTTENTFFKQTKASLEAFQGSPIKKDSKVRQFLKSQLGLQNEHQIPSVFSEISPNNSLWSALYNEHGRYDSYELASPETFKSKAEAVEYVFSYVCSRIYDICADEFIEWALDNAVTYEDRVVDGSVVSVEIPSEPIPVFDFTENNDEPITHGELEKLLASLTTQQKIAVLDWYFDYMDDEHATASYIITELPAAVKEKEVMPKTATVYLVSQRNYDFNENGTSLVLTDVEKTIKLTQEGAEEEVLRLFRHSFPDHDSVASDLLNYSVITTKIEEEFEPGFDEEFADFNYSEALEWVCDNFTIDTLVGEILTGITMDMTEIDYEAILAD